MTPPDKRFARNARDRAPRPEVGTDTVPVDLVELTSVADAKRGRGPMAILAVAAVGILAFAAIVITGRPLAPEPSPTALAAVASPSALTAPPSPTPRPTPIADMVAPTPAVAPTAPTYPWTWVRTPAQAAGVSGTFDGLWEVNGRFLLLTRTPLELTEGYDFAMNASADGQEWNAFAPPPAISAFQAGTVIDDRLWFFAEVRGVNESETSWQLVSTESGEAWESLGTTSGLGTVGGVSLLDRVGGRWVAQVFDFEGGADWRLLSSPDGRAWQEAALPEIEGNVELLDAATIGDRMLLLGRSFVSFEDVQHFILTSTDGATWRRSSFSVPGFLAEVTCGPRTCVAPVQMPEDEERSERELLVSDDGRTWTTVRLELPVFDPGTTVRLIRDIPTGFIAMAGLSGNALLSTDGREWSPIEVMPADSVEWLNDLAVVGDVVMGFAETQDSNFVDTLWRGSLEAMTERQAP